LILKYLCDSKLIIEINSDSLHAPFLGDNSFKKKLKNIFFRLIFQLSISQAHAIKLLYLKQADKYNGFLKNKQVFIYHDYTPTHIFTTNKVKSFYSVDSMPRNQYILFVGSPFFLKGADILIRAFQKIEKKYPMFYLKLIGHQLESDAKQYLTEYSQSIKFYKAMHYNELQREFLDCYCFVLPSRSEGLARVLIEGMASGKPIIGSDVGGTSELISNGLNGFLFRNGDINDLESKLDLLLNNPKLAGKMGEYSSRLAENKFSSEKYYNHFKNMIKLLL
jgi:glycosyltransferase involved in cell wall biosynthesis